MPKVEVVSEGDHLHELYIVLAGLVESIKPGLAESAEDVALQMEPGDPSYHGGTTSRYGPYMQGLARGLFLSVGLASGLASRCDPCCVLLALLLQM